MGWTSRLQLTTANSTSLATSARGFAVSGLQFDRDRQARCAGYRRGGPQPCRMSRLRRSALACIGAHATSSWPAIPHSGGHIIYDAINSGAIYRLSYNQRPEVERSCSLGPREFPVIVGWQLAPNNGAFEDCPYLERAPRLTNADRGWLLTDFADHEA